MDSIYPILDKHIEKLYSEFKTLLYTQNSYSKTVELENITIYISFLEATLQTSFDRLTHADAFLKDPDGLMVSQMYPFQFLTEQTIKRIEEVYGEVARLDSCLDIVKRTH